MRDATYDFGLAPGERFEPDEEDEEPFDLSRPHVMTALGPIDPDDLGFALHHEHVVSTSRNALASDTNAMLDDPARSLAELEDAFVVGLRAIVDMTTAEQGRDLAELIWVAQRSPVHTIVVTGHDLSGYPEALGEHEIDELAAFHVGELTIGIDGTPVKAGLLRIGTSLDRITAREEDALRAAARAHAATGAPISTVTVRGTMALKQIAMLCDEGVDPRRVIVGHLDVALDEAYLLRVLDTGAFASFDQIGKADRATDEARAAMVKRLVDAGYADRLLLSGDLSRKSDLRAYGGGPGWAYLVETFPLVLMEAGLDAPTVRRIFVDNPARALTIRR
jgi:phosphotriesterase-related protein